MKRKLHSAVALAVAVMVVAGAAVRSAAEKKEEAAKKKAAYVHTVFFHLKKDAPKDEDAQMIADCHEMLGKIPTVRELRAGRPAEKDSERFVNKEYNVGLTICFDDYDGLTTYINHELHKKFVEKHLPHIEKVVVYDFQDQAK